MNLEFLKDVKLEPVKKTVKAIPVKLPEDADIRVFANGKVFPSVAFAASAKLEFVAKAVLVEGSAPEVVGNGLDIFSSLDWGMVQDKLPTELLFCYIIGKTMAKVNLWGSTNYNDDGTPKASVFTQGAGTFGKTMLLPMIERTYGIDWNTTEYVDLKIAHESVIASPTGMYDIPKRISGGAKKGEMTNIRRQNITICPIVIQDTKTCLPKKDVNTAPAVIGVVDSSVKIGAVPPPATDPVTFDDPNPKIPESAIPAFALDINTLPPPVVPPIVVAPVASVISVAPPVQQVIPPVIPSGQVPAAVIPVAGQVETPVDRQPKIEPVPPSDWASRLAAIPPANTPMPPAPEVNGQS